MPLPTPPRACRRSTPCRNRHPLAAPLSTVLSTGLAATLALAMTGSGALAATCGDTAVGFQTWKTQFAQEAAALGVGQKGLAALAQATYQPKTIAADRDQHSFNYSFDKFWKIRGGDTIVAQARKKRAADPALYAGLEKRFGVPDGILLAIWGMETGFGHFMGRTNVVSAISTLAYDCRRSDYFTPHALAALKLVDMGEITASSRGALFGELGNTQFMPGNVLKYAVDGNGDGRIDLAGTPADALASTANYLRQKGWQPGAGYMEGQPNHAVLAEWNAASIYQQALAVMAQRIDR